ncbi:MAG: hypothetical protein IKJ74_04355 [Clostridia bacterium]|nr:hypothetical protein [Clostridia bacterium]
MKKNDLEDHSPCSAGGRDPSAHSYRNASHRGCSGHDGGPLPYAMEQFGQHHSGIYSAKEDTILDGTQDSAYTLMDSCDDQSGNYDGIFVSTAEDGSISPAFDQAVYDYDLTIAYEYDIQVNTYTASGWPAE